MLKFKVLLLLSVTIACSSWAQKPVQWTWSYDNDNKALCFKVDLADGWHLYSQHVSNEIGPVPTQFIFEPAEGITLEGEVHEPVPIQKYDPNFEANLDFFEKEAVFTQRIKGEKGEVKGSITYMVCNETMCLPPVDLPFVITLDKN